MKRRALGARCALLVLAGIALAGCAADGSVIAGTPPTPPYPPPGYSHTVRTSHVELYWNCARAESAVVEIRGIAFNPWQSQPVRELEIEIVGVDARERTLSAAHTYAPVTQLFTNQSTPFQVSLRTTGKESRFDLYYRYRFQDDGHDRLRASLAWDGPVLLVQQGMLQQNLVRDACSDSQHRAQ